MELDIFGICYIHLMLTKNSKYVLKNTYSFYSLLVMLLNVKRSFRGNYSCQAQNRAGWGPISEAKEMKVLYPPEGTIISVLPKIITKNKPFEVRRLTICKQKIVWFVLPMYKI